ncbi:MAG: type 1 glutamine amidotransferase domain-containing protein [Urechidicola sp.]|nr:type 1 glutamine amidotransferase domain-containing protein [Urechidicola sp.]
MRVPKILIPLPNYGFDPTEAAIPWRLLTNQNFEIVFATPNGKKATGDRIMLNGERLGIWKKLLAARQDAVDAYKDMENSNEFCIPIKYADAKESDFDALLLPGGHDKGVKEYLESELLQQVVVNFFNAKKPVGAICHGVVLLAKSIDSKTNKSVLYNYKTTCLLKKQELIGYNLTRLWLDDYYLTYPELTVEDEVKSVLSNPTNLIEGSTPILKDAPEKLQRGFCVRDRNYVSARWTGDVYNFSLEFIKMVK